MKTLGASEAFTEGSELWIIPDRKNSFWSRRIDWHLQFLISRSMIHKSPKVSPDLRRIVNENEIDLLEDETPKNAPLLIFSTDLLPNKETVHLPFGNSFQTWVERAHSIWKDLKEPSVRVFLPNAQDAEEFRQYWPNIKKEDSVLSVVVDVGSH